ncbi:tetratricopeptide repeat protein [Massilia sp. DD77]|uniref:tetratricopeptide repeat protein n=1 Tax=Massilia sp. DD77 TaxID=3109349 RepID=UPI0030000E7A
MSARFPVLLTLLLACLPGWAGAQTAGADLPAGTAADTAAEGEVTPQQALYQTALQSLAEGRKSDASKALSRLIEQEPEHAGAWLDLALIQCSLGHGDEAERLFANVETRFSPSREILELISEARDSGCQAWRPSSSLSVSLGRGIDDNVNQGASNSTFIVTGPDGDIELPLLADFLPQRDQYTTVSADYVRDVTANGSLGFVQVLGRRYDQMRGYDTAALYAGIESPWRFGEWALRTTGTAGVTTLGGRLYQKQTQLQARLAPPLPLPPRTQLYLTASATHTDYVSLPAFNANVLEARAQVTHQLGVLAASATGGLLSDQARGDRPGGNRHGNYLTVSLRRPLGWNLSGDLSYTRQSWDSASAYSPELLIDQIRSQRTQVVRAGLAWQISKYQSVVLEGRAVRNRENISIFQYNNRQLQLSWQWRYP